MANYDEEEVSYEEGLLDDGQAYDGEEGLENENGVEYDGTVDDEEGVENEDGAEGDFAENPYVGLTRSESFPVTEEEKSADLDKLHPPIKVLDANEEWIPMMGTIDTGCEDNWISQAKLEELGLQMEELDDPNESFTTFAGSNLTPIGQVTIQWHGAKIAKSSHLDCKVAEDVPDEDPPFDVLFGGVYFVEHAFEDFDSPVLILKSNPKSHSQIVGTQIATDQYQKKAQVVTAERSAEQAVSRRAVAYDGDDVPE